MRALDDLEQSVQRRYDAVDSLVAAVQIQSESVDQTQVPASVIRLVDMLAKIDSPVARSALLDLLDSNNSDFVMLCSDTLGKHQVFEAIEKIGQLSQREEYQNRYAFRFNLVRSLAMMKHPDAIEQMGQLQPKLDGQLRFEIDNILSDVTVEDFRGDQERFEKWKNREVEPPKKTSGIFKPASTKGAGPNPDDYLDEDRIKLRRPQYYGIEIQAQRVLFVLDRSGSMRAMTNYGTRLLRAKQELIKAITELPEDAEFAIVAFDTSIRPWREELSEANDKNKRAAITYVQRLQYGSDTNTYGALRRALDFDDDLEAVYLLTDGKPTRGQVIRPAEITRDIIHRNRWRHLNFNTIGISVGGQTEIFLRNLAENTGGEFRAAN